MSAPRPNIIFILADDMGFSDIGCFGADDIATPNLDELAKRGVRQSAFYNCARCCPTRASLMTGAYPHRAGIGHMVSDYGIPAYRGFLNPDLPTIAERMHAAGYQTWMSGKWHVGGEYAVAKREQWEEAGDAKHPLPTQRGFDRYYGILCGACSYFDPRTLMDQNHFVEPEELPADYYFTDELGHRAAGFIDEVPADKPFFGYLAFTAPHWPLHAPEADVAPYRERYLAGWDELRAQRLRTLVRNGVLPADQALSERDPQSKPWSDASDHAWEAERMAVYAAQITAMDRAIGTMIESLRRSGRLDNTLIVFCSDNGGCAEYLREDGESGKWPEQYSLPTKTGTQCKVGNSRHISAGPAETFMSYDLPWANASNAPFRKFKSWTHEGGISSPLVACWPKGLPADSVAHHAGHIIDLGATACALAGADANGIDGVDLTAAWAGTAAPARNECLAWEHQGHAALREGDLKIVKTAKGDWELYDLANDRIEQRDLANEKPDVVKRLATQWRTWADRVGVEPFPVAKR